MMTPRRVFLPLASILLATLLASIVNSLAQAKPVVDQRADSKTTFNDTAPTQSLPSAHLLSSSNQTSASPFSTTGTASKIPSTTPTSQSTAVPVGNARMDSSPVSGPLATFCDDFVRQCYKSALQGQTGDVVVSHACMRNGGKSSTSFTYICTRNGETITAAVLKSLGRAYHRPSTTTTIDDFSVVTKLVEDVATDLKTTTKLTTSTGATITNTLWASVVNVEVKTIPSTILSTRVISETLSLTSTATRSATTTATSLETISTETEVLFAGGEVPVYQVIISEDEDGLQRRAPSTFCLAYKIACQTECAKVSSRVRTWICRSELPTYSLACECRNGKRETQHALEAVAEDRKIRSITRVGASTVYLTSTRTTTLLTEVLNTKLATRTTSVARTTTFSTTTSTTVLGGTTSYTSRTSTVETGTTTIFPTTVISTTSTTLQVTATTQFVLASTGYIHGFDLISGSDLGTIVTDDTIYAALRSIPAGTGTEFMAVRDNPTGLYKLVATENPRLSLIQRLSLGTHSFSSGTTDNALLGFAPYADCGTAGTAAGPPDPTLTYSCEAYIFSPLAFDELPGATKGTVNLRPFWINPVQFPPANTSGAWAHGVGQDVVRHIADRHVFTTEFPNFSMEWFSLRFPFGN